MAKVPQQSGRHAESRVSSGAWAWVNASAIIHIAPDLNDLQLRTANAGTMREAWRTKQSGYAGPLVLQQVTTP